MRIKRATQDPRSSEVSEAKADAITRPLHYRFGEVECIEAICAQSTPEEYRGYLKNTVTKYIWRERHKGGTDSLRKAQWFLEKLIEYDCGYDIREGDK